MSRTWHKQKPVRAVVGALALALPVVAVASSSASAANVNLVVNAGLQTSGSGLPACFQAAGSGTNSYRVGTSSLASTGSTALQVSISKYTSGERLARISENAACAPAVTPGHEYNLSLDYMSSSPDAVIEVYRKDAAGWSFWMDLKNLPAASRYQTTSVRTPEIPDGTTQISFGVALYGAGTLISDHYSMTDITQSQVASAAAVKCTAGAACTKGKWQVLAFPSPVRSVHSVVLYNGDVLLVAGSGNNPKEFAAGSFESALYNPTKGTFKVIPTPDDFFCAGHVQLSDGNVLILGGNKRYPDAKAPAGQQGYEGLATSYIFDPVTEKYIKVNNLNGGHWYPSATELGNGDIISYGGLNETSSGSTVTEYFKYDKSPTFSSPDSSTDGEWLPSGDKAGTVNQSYDYWGLYPAMVLMQNGELFYSGSHVFGNNQTAVGDDGGKDGKKGAGKGNGGAGILNIADITNSNPGTPLSATQVNGLQDNPGGPDKTDMVDQSMSVLLPPAQNQEVFLAGGGNTNYTDDPATRLTDLINLKAANPKYTPGPLLLRGTLSNGKLESTTEGKMYDSLVLLPNGNVLETGGGLINREDPVYEASIINTAKLEANPTSEAAYTPVASDPVWRGYHSQSFLLPDGRVMSIGNNPGDGSFDMRISVYTPPYLFQGARPAITGLASSKDWVYGKSYAITTNTPITKAVLIRPAAVTHQSDPNQRYVELPITGTGTKLSLNLTSNPNIAPPGWYMLFVDNANGVPSVAKWVHVG